MGTPTITTFAADATTDGAAVYANDVAIATQVNGGLVKSTNVDEYKTQWAMTHWEPILSGANLALYQYYVIWFKQINSATPTLVLAEAWLEGTSKGLGGGEKLTITVEQSSSPTSGFSAISPTSGTSAIDLTAEGTRYTRSYSTAIAQNNYVRVKVLPTSSTAGTEYGLYIRLVFEQDSEN